MNHHRVENNMFVKKYVACIEYIGTNYRGWSKQPNTNTIQSQVEKSLSLLANEKIEIYGAGRTDAGVHATSQVIHFSSSAKRENKAWLSGTNHYLPDDISLKFIDVIDVSFHARYSACYRRYNYVFYTKDYRSALYENTSLWIDKELDIDSMNMACQYIIGEHDFSTWRSAKCGANNAIRHVTHAFFKRVGDFIIFDIQANAFLYNMVRNFLGTLVEIGHRKKSPTFMAEALSKKDRQFAPFCLSAKGLHFVGVGYKNFPAIPSCNPLSLMTM